MPTQSIKTDNFTNACLVHTPIENIYFLNTQFWCATDSMLPGIWYKNNPQQYKNDVCLFFFRANLIIPRHSPLLARRQDDGIRLDYPFFLHCNNHLQRGWRRIHCANPLPGKVHHAQQTAETRMRNVQTLDETAVKCCYFSLSFNAPRQKNRTQLRPSWTILQQWKAKQN